jgi:4-hydroxy-tetrahydrodipicolinate reductase
MKFGIQGILGRMGQAITAAAAQDQKLSLVAGIEHGEHPDQGKTLLELGCACPGASKDLRVGTTFPSDIQGIIDFSAPASTIKLLPFAKDNSIALVIGTTGFSPEQEQQIQLAAGSIAVVRSNNMALGVNMLFALTRVAARVLSKNGFDPELFEIHHGQKKDSPSGTARTLEQVILNEYNLTETNLIHGREGLIGERPSNEVGSFALRGGDVVGDHTVYFLGEGERVVLQHQATSRQIFAKGSLTALKFAIQAGPGLYNMADVLGIE